MVVKAGNRPRTLIGYNKDSESMKMKPQTQRFRSIEEEKVTMIFVYRNELEDKVCARGISI